MSSKNIPDWAYSVTQTLLATTRERDPYTFGHSKRVSYLAKLLAKAIGLNEYQQRIVELSSIFHDLGKIGIPDSILLKPGKLTPEEIQIMKTHPVKSEQIVKNLSVHPFFADTLPGVRHHHERFDGRGYPDGLAGDQIPLIARIILVCDTFDAMTTTRPYRKGMPEEVAFKELLTFSGRQFDPRIVKAFNDAHSTWDPIDEELTDTFIAKTFKRAA